MNTRSKIRNQIISNTAIAEKDAQTENTSNKVNNRTYAESRMNISRNPKKKSDFRKIGSGSEKSACRKSPRLLKNPVYKNVSGIFKNFEKEKAAFGVYEFEADSNEEQKEETKRKTRKKPKGKPARKKFVNNNCFKNVHFVVTGKTGSKTVRTSMKPALVPLRPVTPRRNIPIRKVVRTIGKIPIAQIVPSSSLDNRNEMVEQYHTDIDLGEADNNEAENIQVYTSEHNLNQDHAGNVFFNSPTRTVDNPTENQTSPIPYFDVDFVADHSKGKSASATSDAAVSFYGVFNPVVHSSAIKRAQDPAASPWRVEGTDQIRQNRVNVYTRLPVLNMSSEHSLPSSSCESNLQISENNPKSSDESMKSTSIISFYREVISKKPKHTPKTTHDLATNLESHPASHQNNSDRLTISNSCSLEPCQSNIVPLIPLPVTPTKVGPSTLNTNKSATPMKIVDYFGFDESEDRENISPNKQFVNCRRRERPKRAERRPLIELNDQLPSNVVRKFTKSTKNSNIESNIQIAHSVAPIEVDKENAPIINPESSDDTPEEDSVLGSPNIDELGLIAQQVALFEDPVLPEAPSFQEPPINVYKTRKRNVKRNVVMIADSDHSDNSDAEDFVKRAMYRHRKKKTRHQQERE